MKIRKAKESDYPAVISLIKELAEFEDAGEKVTNSPERMKREKDLFECLVVENKKKEIIGMALYFYAYFTWVGKSLYLDDIYVREGARHKGVGSRLLEKVLETAKNNDCKRVRCQALDWNKRAIDIYKKRGAVTDNEWINCDFELE